MTNSPTNGGSGSTRTRGRLGFRSAVVIASLGIAATGAIALAADASAHSLAVSGQASCQTDGTYNVDWTIDISNVPAGATGTISLDAQTPNTVSPKDIATGVPSTQASVSYTQTGVPGTSLAASITVHGTWSDNYTSAPQTGSVTLDGTCAPPTSTPPTSTPPTSTPPTTTPPTSQPPTSTPPTSKPPLGNPPPPTVVKKAKCLSNGTNLEGEVKIPNAAGYTYQVYIKASHQWVTVSGTITQGADLGAVHYRALVTGTKIVRGQWTLTVPYGNNSAPCTGKSSTPPPPPATSTSVTPLPPSSSVYTPGSGGTGDGSSSGGFAVIAAFLIAGLIGAGVFATTRRGKRA